MAGIDLPLADELAQLAARMSPLLLSAETVATAVQTLTGLAHEAVAAATGAGVSLMDDQGRRTSTGATSRAVLLADTAQYQCEEGPCLTAWAELRVVRIDDLSTDPRWPRWSDAVRPLPVRSVVSAPLVSDDRPLGAVKVYSSSVDAFDERTERLLSGIADAAAVLLANVVSLDNERRLSAGLQRAMRDRDTLQLAKGIVMQRDGVPEEAAFALLAQQARASGQPLLELAAAVVETTSHAPE
ncbi:MAG: GAF and ANTAR domain-containing protein [Friedmanniella sp.]